MDNLPVISVIVPAYRAEATLAACVRSVLAGAPQNLELLLVEDGSPDGTGALCDALAASDSRICALHRPNGGAAAARNTGLASAHGQYIMFADADDVLLPGLWAVLGTALAGRPGLVLFGMRRASGDAPCPLAPGRYPGPQALGSALGPLLFESGYLAAPYAKLFRADLLQTPPLRFEEALAVNEDVLFNLQFLQKFPPICCLAGVYYTQNDILSGSLSRRLRGDLLAAEAITRPELDKLLQMLHRPDREAFLRQSRTRACLNQYGLLSGCRGRLPFAQRRALFAAILADRDARAQLSARLKADPNRLLALPYRFGVACGLPGWLAAYTLLKNHFLP
jgi:hypothetical protein